VRRRDFVLRGLAVGITTWSRAVRAAPAPDSTLNFYHIHTREHLKVNYREQGRILPDALDAIAHLLRDFRRQETHPIEVALLDTLSALYERFERRGHFEVISGYRAPRTNEALRRVTTGVAKDSLHLHGRAIDIRLTSADTATLRDAALSLQQGGVGYYPESKFVHIDTGRLRSWQG